MGSFQAAEDLPQASSPSLILTNPTPGEKIKIWTLSHAMWGQALSLEDYLKREEYLCSVPLARDGGITHWVLTVADLPPDQRPLLSSCESIRKRAIACQPGDGTNGDVRDGVAHGIASVFTDPQYRGKGYAGRMLRELSPRLRGWQVGDDSGEKADTTTTPAGAVVGGEGEGEAKTALFSVLYSDIGKTFYASKGWAPFESSHLSFPPEPAAEGKEPEAEAEARPLGYDDLAELCAADEKLLRSRLRERASSALPPHKKATAALLPSHEAMLWHLNREDFMVRHIFGRVPTVRGAVFGSSGEGPGHGRLWALWTRGYYGGLERTEGNTLHILRVVAEDESETDENAARLARGLAAVVGVARREAAEWRCADVQMWNPSPLLRRAAAASGVPHVFVDRDNESIASLMWYGAGCSTDELDWFANEKFGWC